MPRFPVPRFRNRTSYEVIKPGFRIVLCLSRLGIVFLVFFCVFEVHVLFYLLLFGCQYTSAIDCLGNDLLCVELDVKPY